MEYSKKIFHFPSQKKKFFGKKKRSNFFFGK